MADNPKHRRQACSEQRARIAKGTTQTNGFIEQTESSRLETSHQPTLSSLCGTIHGLLVKISPAHKTEHPLMRTQQRASPFGDGELKSIQHRDIALVTTGCFTPPASSNFAEILKSLLNKTLTPVNTLLHKFVKKGVSSISVPMLREPQGLHRYARTQ